MPLLLSILALSIPTKVWVGSRFLVVISLGVELLVGLGGDDTDGIVAVLVVGLGGVDYRVDVQTGGGWLACEGAEALDKLFLKLIVEIILLAKEDNTTLRD